MYLVAFGKDCNINEVRTSSILGQAETLEEAAAMRKLCGDLIFDAETLEIVQDTSWLWEAEKTSQYPDSTYARKAIENKVKLVFIRSW